MTAGSSPAVAAAAPPAAVARHPLPTGTVTFLFTDIEGSTRRVLDLGAGPWASLLDRHRAILRAAIEKHGGIEVKTEGDSIFAVFARAPAAIAAAAEAQRGLNAERWPGETPIRVRMGLHTGEGHLDADGDYVGADVHRAARIGAAGHGGQVLVSEPTRALAAGALPAGVSFLDLGEHRLKDLRTERLAQLRIEGVPCEFPPLHSLDAHPNNLPTQLTSFVGRDRELKAAGDLLAATRLLTLAGPGGTGKTRLALQLGAMASDRFPGGVWFVQLEPIRDPALVAPTIARTLGLAGSRPALEAIAESIGDKRVLLILDNFEQVLGAAPVTGELLRAAPNLSLLVTSRAVLHVSGEQVFEVPGLPAPPDLSHLSKIELENLPAGLRSPDPATLSQYEAVKLFIARATAVRPDFAVTNQNAPAVAQICARLHGMPLAIELAAARIKLLTPAQILARLDRQLALLTSGSRDLPERQQTLRGAIAWSYDLLDPPARSLLGKLSVFSGGWDLSAAEALCDEGGGAIDVLDGLSALVDQSLVRREEVGGETRFDMFPTIREFAAEQVAASGRTQSLAACHAAHYLGLAEEAARHLSGADQRMWLDRLEREHDNLRAALDWASGKPAPEVAARLGFALWRLWQQRGYLDEARRRLEGLTAQNWELAPEVEARLYEATGGVAYWQADDRGARHWYEKQLALWEKLGDRGEIANALYNVAYGIMLPIMRTQQLGHHGAEEELARSHLDSALALYRELGNRLGEGNAIWGLGTLAFYANRLDRAKEWFLAGKEIFRAGGQRTMLAWCQHMLAMTALREREARSAAGEARDALSHFHGAGDLSGVAMMLSDVSGIAAVADQIERAARLHGASRVLQVKTGAALVAQVEELLEEKTRVLASTDKPTLDRLTAEGAAMPLDEAVGYAFETLGLVDEASPAARGPDAAIAAPAAGL